jgi:hypothetical protein
MVKVERRIRVHRDGRVLEALALFDTGSRRSYFSKVRLSIGLVPDLLGEVEVPLAVRGKYGKLVGDTTVYIEVEGYILPEREVVGVIEGLRVDAIIGLNVMESYGIYIENNEVKFKHVPPTSMII